MDKIQLLVTTDHDCKTMHVQRTERGFEVADPNGNGYYKVKGLGKVDLIEVLGEGNQNKPRNTDNSDKDILSMDKPNNINCKLWTAGGGIADAIYEVLYDPEA